MKIPLVGHMVRSRFRNKLLPISYAGIYSLALAFLMVNALVSRWTFLPIGKPNLPIVATPKIVAFRAYAHPWEGPIPMVSVDKNGRIFVGRTVVAVDRLRDELTEAQKQSGIDYVLLNVDKRVPCEKVISIVKIVQALGVDRVGLVASY